MEASTRWPCPHVGVAWSVPGLSLNPGRSVRWNGMRAPQTCEWTLFLCGAATCAAAASHCTDQSGMVSERETTISILYSGIKVCYRYRCKRM